MRTARFALCCLLLSVLSIGGVGAQSELDPYRESVLELEYGNRGLTVGNWRLDVAVATVEISHPPLHARKVLSLQDLCFAGVLSPLKRHFRWGRETASSSPPQPSATPRQ